jgi:hypothetical protein
MQTSGGTYFDFVDPDSSTIAITDIAHALSNICRFTGHPRDFYSVAEHSIFCSQLVPQEDAAAALMHDAAEAYCGDVSSPLRSLLPGYEVILRRVEAALSRRFGMPLLLPETVKIADRKMLRLEQRFAMDSGDRWAGLDYEETLPRITLRFWSPRTARQQFLSRAMELGITALDKTSGSYR